MSLEKTVVSPLLPLQGFRQPGLKSQRDVRLPDKQATATVGFVKQTIWNSHTLSARWSVVGWIVTGLLGALALVMIVVSAWGLLGGASESRIECDRGAGECRASFDLIKRRKAGIAGISGVELLALDRRFATRSSETQSYIALRVNGVEQAITPSSAEARTVAAYAAAVTQLQVFLAGKEQAPAIAITIATRASRKSNMHLSGSGILILLMAGAGYIKLRGRRK